MISSSFKRGMSEGYFGQIIDELLDEAGVNTARISTLGIDRVSSQVLAYCKPPYG